MSILKRIWVPKSVRPHYACLICGDEFTENESAAYERHVAKCAATHHDELKAAQDHARPPGFKPQDAEYAAWLKQYG